MTEKTFKYTTGIKQPQKVANIRLDPSGGTITERELKALKKDAYGASLLEKGMMVIEAAPEAEPASAPTGDTNPNSGETIPDFEGTGYEEKNPSPQEHAGWKPE